MWANIARELQYRATLTSCGVTFHEERVSDVGNLVCGRPSMARIGASIVALRHTPEHRLATLENVRLRHKTYVYVCTPCMHLRRYAALASNSPSTGEGHVQRGLVGGELFHDGQILVVLLFQYVARETKRQGVECKKRNAGGV